MTRRRTASVASASNASTACVAARASATSLAPASRRWALSSMANSVRWRAPASGARSACKAPRTRLRVQCTKATPPRHGGGACREVGRPLLHCCPLGMRFTAWGKPRWVANRRKWPELKVLMRRAFNTALDAYWRFLADDGWAIASHIALSALMAMFPFFILLTSLAGVFGSSELPDEVAKLMLATWPEEVALPIAREIHDVLTTTHTGALTIGAVFAIFFASSGVESLRIGLNRAYGVVETRHWILLRLESIAYVLVAAVGLLALGFLIVLGPLIFRTALRYAPWLEP